LQLARKEQTAPWPSGSAARGLRRLLRLRRPADTGPRRGGRFRRRAARGRRRRLARATDSPPAGCSSAGLVRLIYRDGRSSKSGLLVGAFFDIAYSGPEGIRRSVARNLPVRRPAGTSLLKPGSPLGVGFSGALSRRGRRRRHRACCFILSDLKRSEELDYRDSLL